MARIQNLPWGNCVRAFLFPSSRLTSIVSPLTGKSILVTGGAGFFGKAFVRRALDDGASRIAVFSRDEAKHALMKSEFPEPRLRYLVGDVRDLSRITEATRGVDIVVHAAALKRVETCESDPNEAVATNITGTQNVAKACIKSGVSKAILLSTDKAAAPNTLYGSTKLCAERIWNGQNVYSAGTPTRFSVTRYGNVVGSTGSVIPTWRAQRPSGELGITESTMTRFFMHMDEAVNLVLLAIVKMRGGEIFVPKLKQARITELAKAFAPECSVRSIGIRPGEKLHEVLITEDEARTAHDCHSHFVIEPESRSWGNVPKLAYPKVPFGFEYRSITSENFSIEELRRLVA